MRPLWLWLLLKMTLVVAPRPFDGTYTVVNKDNGRRLFASTQAGLFVVDDSGPIYNDQMWLFAPQDNQSFAIVNAANGLRVLAQSAVDGESGFFALDNGPIYQDQRWWLSPQSDGSYAIVNVKSGRRILARIDSVGKLRFAANADAGPIQADETWWIINQERDETARFMMELDLEKERVARLANQTAMAKSEAGHLMQRLQTALKLQLKLADDAKFAKQETLSSTSRLETERSSFKASLARDVAAHQSELVRLQSELVMEKRSKGLLVEEVRTGQAQKSQRDAALKEARAAHGRLSEELNASGSEKQRLAAELDAVQDSKGKLIDTVSGMQSQVARLSVQLSIAGDSSVELASKVKVFEAQAPCWMPRVHVDFSVKLLATVLAIALVAGFASCGRQVVGLLIEVKGKRKRISALEQELHAEFGDMVCVGDSHSGLGTDFGYCVFNTEINQEAVRLVKVQCPGVKHVDVEIELIFNGCEVTIHRQASRGVESATWKRRFQFKPSDGLFEFREEQMMLEDGFLQLVFRACAFQSRRVLFPRHFNLTDSDADACWNYEADEAEHCDDADAWWNDAPGANKPGSLAEVDTESTASTARVLV